MTKCLILGLILLVCQPTLAQKNKDRRSPDNPEIPSLKETYERFSVFRFMGDNYVHQQTNNVFTETFLEINPETNTIKLPGIGVIQECSFKFPDCEFHQDSIGIYVARIPIDCNTSNGIEKRDLRLHCIHQKRRVSYLFSIDVPGSKDRILYHSYTDKDLGNLIASRQIRFE